MALQRGVAQARASRPPAEGLSSGLNLRAVDGSFHRRTCLKFRVDDILPFPSMRKMKRAAPIFLAWWLAWAQGPTEPTPKPPVTAEDIEAGARIYRTQCAYCHGPQGEGGRGAVLARPRLMHAPDDTALFNVI